MQTGIRFKIRYRKIYKLVCIHIVTMNCKHKNKIRLYKRMPTTWTSRDLWECEDCGAILGVAQIKLNKLNNGLTMREKTKDTISEEVVKQ